jgi:beta-galactosidase
MEKICRKGGNLIVTCRTGLMNRNGHFPEAPWADFITKLIGAKITMNDMLGADKSAKVLFNGTAYTWNVWGDILQPLDNTEAWATYADQFYAGKPAVVHCRQGRGTVTYIGVDSKDGRLEKEIVKKLFNKEKIPVDEQLEGVMVNWRDGFWVAVNYSSEKVFINIPAKSQLIFGGKELEPAGVAVWR